MSETKDSVAVPADEGRKAGFMGLPSLGLADRFSNLPLWARKELRNEFWTSVDEMTADTHS